MKSWINSLTGPMVLLANAIFSMLSGVFILVFSRQMTRIFGLPSLGWMLGVGITLIAYGLLIAVLSKTQGKLQIRGLWFATINDLIWVIGSIMLYLNQETISINLQTEAVWLLFGTGLIVLDFSILQANILAKTPSSHVVSRIIDATPEEAWVVIADIEGYDQYAEEIIETKLLPSIDGAVIRQCQDKRGKWKETCSNYSPNKTYTMEVDTSDYPYPFEYFSGTWSVEEMDQGTRISVEFTYIAQGWIFGKILMDRVMPKIVRESTQKLFDNYELGIKKKSDQIPIIS